MNEENYEAGVKAANAFYTSKYYKQFEYEIRPEDAAKIFLPGVAEMKMEMQMPLPKPRQEWLRGFKEEQERILNLTL